MQIKTSTGDVGSQKNHIQTMQFSRCRGYVLGRWPALAWRFGASEALQLFAGAQHVLKARCAGQIHPPVSERRDDAGGRDIGRSRLICKKQNGFFPRRSQLIGGCRANCTQATITHSVSTARLQALKRTNGDARLCTGQFQARVLAESRLDAPGQDGATFETRHSVSHLYLLKTALSFRDSTSKASASTRALPLWCGMFYKYVCVIDFALMLRTK